VDFVRKSAQNPRFLLFFFFDLEKQEGGSLPSCFSKSKK
jgi:hypothetical protein